MMLSNQGVDSNARDAGARQLLALVLVSLALGLLAPVVAEAQAAGGIPRLCFLT